MMFKHYEKQYKTILESNDTRALWRKIDWSGKYNNHSKHHMPIQVMADYFENIYEPLDINEIYEADNLQTNMYVPITDDPISTNEINQAYSKMKKGGYDYSLDVLKLLTLFSFS